MTDDSGLRVGFFGKLPSHGDFVRRDFPPPLYNLWDSWLQSGLAASRELLGSGWLECYLSAPIWRFCLSPGLCGDEQWIGALMPSVDRVGRYFPLTTVVKVPAGSSLFLIAATSEAWFRDLEEAMLSALDDDNPGAGELEARLGALSPIDVTETSAQRGPDSGDQCSITVRLTESARLESAAGTLADALARHSFGNFSLWWGSGSAHVAPGARIYSTLPPADRFWTLLCGERSGD